ncbi:sec61a, partial [Symbiodinium pilosum]
MSQGWDFGMACLKFGGIGFDVDFLEQRGVDFARRLNEGIGSWTRVLAVGTPGSGDLEAATEEVTAKYLDFAKGSDDEVAAWRRQIQAAREDPSGQATQSRTCHGYTLLCTGMEDDEISEELRMAQRAFDAQRAPGRG